MKFLNNKKELINWVEYNDIEFRRQSIQQDIIEKSLGLTNIDHGILQNEEINIILDIGSGYCRWLINIIRKHKLLMNKLSIYYYDIVDNLGIYLKKFVNIENSIKDEIMEIGLYCIFVKKDLKKECFDFKDNSISFIYHRDMLIVYNMKEWIFIIKEIDRVLKINCKCEFVEYSFIIKNIEKKSLTDKINNYVRSKINNIDEIFKKINKKWIKNKYKIIKVPLYKEPIYKCLCIESIILFYSYFITNILKVLNSKYKIVLTYNELIEILIAEWEINKSYTEIYFITVTK